ncbi:MAG TPA: YeeE/YedE thiosulfate transporter family protein [Archangium sp.]|nr:YeeE/YedE thiosulfate transporter family protein [Archangium sp.]
MLLDMAGQLVGFGSRLGNGCTSGHGIYGISRGSARSIVG